LECTMQREESTDATGIATRIRNGQLRPDDVLDAAIARLVDTNETANAVIHTRFDEARAEGARGLHDGPLRGVPMLGKELGNAGGATTRFAHHAERRRDGSVWVTSG